MLKIPAFWISFVGRKAFWVSFLRFKTGNGGGICTPSGMSMWLIPWRSRRMRSSGLEHAWHLNIAGLEMEISLKMALKQCENDAKHLKTIGF